MPGWVGGIIVAVVTVVAGAVITAATFLGRHALRDVVRTAVHEAVAPLIRELETIKGGQTVQDQRILALEYLVEGSPRRFGDPEAADYRLSRERHRHRRDDVEDGGPG